MFDFFILIFMLSFVLFILGLIKPSFIKLKSRKKVLAIGSAVILSLFILIGVAAGPVADNEAIETEEINQLEEEKLAAQETKEAEEAKKAKESEEAKKAKEAEEAKKAKDAEEAKKAKDAEEAKKAKDAEEAKKAKEAEEAKKAKKAKEAEETKKANLSDLKAHFIDVGQGDAILLEYSSDETNYTILIDSGDWRSEAAVNYLNQMNVKDIDLLVGTHPHADHIGQMATIIDQFNVSEVWMSGAIATSQVFERTLHAIENNDVGYNEPKSGEAYSIGPLDIKVVAPTNLNGNLNDTSIAFKATYGGISFLFTGDAEKSSEQTMLSNGADLKADILKLGHHGSDTSSTASFVEAVSPKVGIISVGENNSYGHPSASVIDRMESRGVDLYSTSNNGTVIVETNGKNYTITTNKDGNVTPSSKGSSNSTSKSASKKTTEKKSPPPKEAANGNCIDINTADEVKIQEIIHIGPVRSGDLIEGRPYNSVDDLTKIKGIGPARIDDIKAQGLACVGG